MTDEYVAKFDKYPEKSELNSWKHSLPAIAKVITNANLDDQVVLLEYCPPSPDEFPYRIDVTVSGLDENRVLNFVFIELKQWTSVMPGKEPGFVLVKSGKEWVPRKHPRKQVEEYRHYMQHVFDSCRISKYMAKISVVAYLHNLSNPNDAEKDALYGKIAPEEDSKLYTLDFEKALAKTIREKVGFGDGSRAIKFLNDIRIKSKENFERLPTSKVPMPKGFRTRRMQFRHDQIFAGTLVMIALGILVSSFLYFYFQIKA